MPGVKYSNPNVALMDGGFGVTSVVVNVKISSMCNMVNYMGELIRVALVKSRWVLRVPDVSFCTEAYYCVLP